MSYQTFFVDEAAIERVHVPGARHGFIQRPGPDRDKRLAPRQEFIGRQLGRE